MNATRMSKGDSRVSTFASLPRGGCGLECQLRGVLELICKITGTGGKDKAVVLGIRQRGGEIRAAVVPDTSSPTLLSHVEQHVERGASVYTDTYLSYRRLGRLDYDHKVIDHAEKYVDGRVHTNGLENFWSLLKRGLHGTYVSVQPFSPVPVPR